ncbi:YceI family protein [Caulobacter segnis]|uniref:YceI family protein n=1 Tax=Caulobacter segnis TaxID=88688 RepID=UPI00240F1682|nr:YceI family protein [Caulobacter segnis]MDG2521083.1 YceI family protein [Caulobacter segnis]
MAESRNRYTTVAIVLHWLIAAAIIFQIILGWRAGDAPKGPSAFAMIQLHKSIGITILLLSLARLAWRLTHRPPPHVADQPRWQTIASHAVHWGFYAIMIGLPLTGWIMVSASRLNIPTVLYGTIPWPHLPFLPELPADAKAVWRTVGDTGHGVLVKLTYVLLLLHLGAVAKHQILDRDQTFGHMAPGAKAGWKEPRAWLAAIGFVAVVGGAYAWSPKAKPAPAPTVQEETVEVAEAPAPEQAAPAPVATDTPAAEEALPAPMPPVAWTVSKSSTLGFSTSWGGEAVEGRFSRWTADILFSPDALDTSKVSVKIDLSSVATGDGQRDESLVGSDFFDTGSHPTATFTATKFRKTAEGRFVADGTLDLRGVKRPVSLPFSLKIDGDTARMRGVTSLDRTAFGVGQGEWTATDEIPAKVSVRVDLTATKR